MSIGDAVALIAAALVGGALNAVAGGGSFVAFPVLLFTGVPPVNANATTTVALWPGSLASVGAYRSHLERGPRLLALGAASLLGGVIGALILLHTPQSSFQRLIPYLLLFATLLFTFGSHLTALVRARMGPPKGSSPRALAGITVAQLVIGLYGGYFGAGIGIVMLAALGFMGMKDIHEMNALKTVLATCANGAAVLTFVIARAAYWPQALIMIAGSIAGGYAAAHYAQRLDPLWVRRLVIAVGVIMTVYFFVR